MDLRSLDFVLAALGALAAGAINALAGGGTLITFPLLTFLGIPAVAAKTKSNKLKSMLSSLNELVKQRQV